MREDESQTDVSEHYKKQHEAERFVYIAFVQTWILAIDADSKQ